MTTLTRYEAARRALAEAHRIDEVKSIRDKAMAMQVYAEQAKDRELIEMATDIKLRAERRAGQRVREMPKNKGTSGTGDANIGNSTGGRAERPPVDTTPKLSDLGITKDESSRWQRLAALPEAQFEEKLSTVKNSLRAKTEGGRHKASKPRENKRGRVTPKQDMAREIVREKLVANEPINPHKLEKQHPGISHVTFDMAITAELARKEAIEEKTALDTSHLSKSAQEKLDAAIRAYKRKVDSEIYQRVLDEAKKRIDEIILPSWKQKIDEAHKLYRHRRGAMDKETFNKIRRALHPDSRHSISDKVLAEAFDTFMSLEKFLLDEKDSPTHIGDLPRTWDEWEKAKQAASAARRAKRTTGTIVRR